MLNQKMPRLVDYTYRAKEFDHMRDSPIRERLPHLMLGFVGEWGEFLNVKGTNYEDLVSEGGDVLWYGGVMLDAVHEAFCTADSAKWLGADMEMDGEEADEMEVTESIMSLSERVKKVCFHGGEIDKKLTEAAVIAFAFAISYVCWRVRTMAGVGLHGIAEHNIRKLEKRRDRQSAKEIARDEITELVGSRSNTHGGWFATNEITHMILEPMYAFQAIWTKYLHEYRSRYGASLTYGLLVPMGVHHVWFGTQMVAEKIARAASGSQDEEDQIENWRDIAGYAMCVLNNLDSTAKDLNEIHLGILNKIGRDHDNSGGLGTTIADYMYKAQNGKKWLYLRQANEREVVHLIRTRLFVTTDAETLRKDWNRLLEMALAIYAERKKKSKKKGATKHPDFEHTINGWQADDWPEVEANNTRPAYDMPPGTYNG